MPAKFTKLLAALRAWGVTVEKPHKSSHWKTRYNGKMYPIPKHGKDVPDCYVRGACHAFDFDLNEFKKSI